MTYRELARRAGYSASALSAAASGQALPTLDVLLAYVGACGADADDWQRRWQELSAARLDQDPDALAGPGGGSPADPPVQPAPVAAPVPTPVAVASEAPSPVPPERGMRPRRLVRPVRLGLATIILATAAIVAYVILQPASPDTRAASGHPQSGLTASAGTAQHDGVSVGQSSSAGSTHVRFDFEHSDDKWGVFWGQGHATGGITGSEAYRGTHSYEVTITGSTASKGYSAIGTIHGLQGLRPGMRVTVHLWSSSPADTAVSFFAQNPSSGVSRVPHDPSEDIPLPSGPAWSTMTWTVPAVGRVHAIGVQIHSDTNAPLVVAIDDVSW